jgi:hydroxymethylbilane synthase
MTVTQQTKTLVMGTRGSALALAQSRQVAALLEHVNPGLKVTERIIRTTGDKQQGAPLPQIGGKGVFTLEIEQALLSGDIDFAVHSLKDLPPDLPAGLHLGAIPERASAGDVAILHPDVTAHAQSDERPLGRLPEQARIGTSSLRRSAQLLALRPDLRIENVRGNIDTRLQKLRDVPFDAIILAAAGLHRLGVHFPDDKSLLRFNEREFVPAPGQGALALEARADDETTNTLLNAIEHESTRGEILAERATMRFLQAGCSTPLGARAVCEGSSLRMWAVVLSTDGTRRISAEAEGRAADALVIGEQVAQELLRNGARELLQ